MKNYLNIVFGIITGILFAGALYISVRTPVGTPIQLLPSPTPDPIVVFVGGAVKRPGVYKLPYNARLVDAVQQAGGFLIDADFSQLNLAKKLADGEQIVVPGGTDISTPQLTIGGNGLLFTPTPPAGEPVNINTASVEELDKLPGIGPTSAQKIVEYRDANGPFTRVEDLLKVPGIGPTTLDEIRGLITLGP
jgi:competence protein ComEA